MSDESITFEGQELRELRSALSTALSASSKVGAMYQDGRIRPVAELNALFNGLDRFRRLMDKAFPFDEEVATADESYPMPQSPDDLAPAVDIVPTGETLMIVGVYSGGDTPAERRPIAFTRNPTIAAAIQRAWTR